MRARIRQHAVQNHQPLDGPAQSDRLTVAVVRLADGSVQRFVMDMEQPYPAGRPERRRGRKPPRAQLLYEVVHLLPVRDASERGVLSSDEHTGVQHDGNQEASLPFGEAERRDGSRALPCEGVHVRNGRQRWHSQELLDGLREDRSLS
jgi:hypothetical protein